MSPHQVVKSCPAWNLQ